MSVPQKGSVVLSDGRGRVTYIPPPPTAGNILVSDPISSYKVSYNDPGSVFYPALEPSDKLSMVLNSTTKKIEMDVNTGSTSDTVAAGNDGRLNTPNIIMVKNSSPGAGEFTSIIDAISSITDSTVSHIVRLGPGTYTESATITIPSNVYLEGSSTEACIVQPAGNFNLLEIQSASGISNLTISGVDPSKWAVHCYNANDVVVHDLLIVDCSQGILVEEASDNNCYLFLDNIAIRGTDLATGIQVNNSQSFKLEVVVNNLNFNGTTNNLLIANGPNTSLVAKNISAHADNSGNFLNLLNGADCTAVGCRIFGWNNAFITGDSITNSPSLVVSGCSFDSNTMDINITNPTTSGYFNGYAPFAKSTIHPASSFFITGKDKKIITVSKKGGDFTSVNSALNAITDVTQTNPYIISVGPGIFVESPIIMKSYVALIGSGNAATVIVCNTPNGKAITGADASEVRLCQVSCLSSSAGIGFYYQGTGLNLPFAVNNCTLANAQTLVQVNAIQHTTTMVANNCFVGGNFDSQIGFQVLSTNNISASLVVLNCLLQDLVAPFPNNIAMGSGNGSVLTITNSIIRLGTPNTSTGIILQDGAIGRISNISLKNMDTAILLKSVGSASRLDASNIQFLDCRTNISVDHPNATGQYVGAVDTTKVFINKTALFSIRDRSVNTLIVDKKGFDYTSVATAISAINPILQTVITDGSINITSQSLFNIELDGLAIFGPGIPDSTYAIYIDPSNMILSNPATQTNTVGVQFVRATPLNTFVIFIETGQFIEPPFIVPPFVSVMGRDNNQAILHALDPSSRFIEMSAYTSISNLTISNVNDIALSINSTKLDPIPPMVQIHDCIFYNCGTAIATQAKEFVCNYFLNNLLFLGVSNQGIYIDGRDITPGLDTIKINMNGLFMEASADNVVGIKVEGVHANVLSSNIYFNGYHFNNVIGVSVGDGSTIIIGPSEIENTSYGIQIPNVGAGPVIKFVDVTLTGNIFDLNVQNPATTGIIIVVAERSKIFIDPESTVSVEYTDPIANGKTVVGSLYLGYNNANTTDTISLIKETPAMGVISGGELSSNSGLSLDVSEGYGYLTASVSGKDVLKQVAWDSTNISLPANTASYIYVDPDGSIQNNSSKPSTISNILLGRVHTDDTTVDIIDATPVDTFHINNLLDNYNRDVFGSIFANGSIVTNNSSNELAVSPGKYYFSGNVYRPSGQDYPTIYTSYYHNGRVTFDKSSSQTIVDDTQYDNGTNLVPIGHIVAASLSISTTAGSPTISSAGQFTPSLDGYLVSGLGIPNNTVATFVDTDTMTLSNNALSTATITATFIVASSIALTISTTNGSRTITSTSLFTPELLGSQVVSSSFPKNTRVVSVVNDSTIQLSDAAITTGTTIASLIVPEIIPDSTFVKHSLYLVGQDANEKYLLVYGQDQYSGLEAARSADLPTPPSYFNEGIVVVASIVAENRNGIVSINSERPIPGFNAVSLSSTIYHSNLLGLVNDDHPQYLLVNGTRPMQDNLDIGGFSISNVNLVDNVKVSSHSARHLPNGSDPLTTEPPNTNLSATSTNYVGTANSFSRSDHIHAIDTDKPVTQIPGQSNTLGSSTALARADHVHHIPTDIAANIGTENSMGAAASFARSDHVHQGIHSVKANAGSPRYGDVILQQGFGTTIIDSNNTFTIDTVGGANEFALRAPGLLNISYSAGKTNLGGVSTSIPGGILTVPADITNGSIYLDVDSTVKSNISGTIPDGAVPLGLYTSNSLQVTSIQDLRSYINHNLVFGAPVTQITDQTNSQGTLNQFARADHIHSIPTAAPATTLLTTTNNSQGSAATFARSDHTHAISTDVPVDLLPNQANSAGSSISFSRADHVHRIPTAAPVTDLSADSSNSQGSAATFARSDHSHAILTDTPVTQTPDQNNSAGTSTSLVRADHVHRIPTGLPVSIGTSNTQGSAPTFACSDHVHQGIHSFSANGGTPRFGDLTLQQGDGIIIADDGSGSFSIAAAVPEGPSGPKGDQGSKGDVGSKGDKGDLGTQGAKGDPGTKGDTGATGSAGSKGDVGEKGEKGEVGPYGILGTGINVGSSGVGVFKDKTVAGDLEFKKLNQASNRISIIDNTDTIDFDIITGSTSSTVAAGNDARFGAPEALVVKNSNPGAGEFTSIKAAMDSITDSGPNKRYVIFVNPGIYLEDTIVMKPYTVITGINQKGCVIQPNGPNKHLVIANRKNNIQGLTFTGNNSPGYAAIVYDGAEEGVLRVLDCKFEKLDTILKQTADNGTESAVEIVTCFLDPAINCTTGFMIDSTNSDGRPCITNIKNLLWNADPSNNPAFSVLFQPVGPTTNVSVKNSSFGPVSGQLSGQIFEVSNGATLVSDAVTIKNMGTALSVPNIGSGPALYINAMNLINCSTNIDIQHPMATGHFDGYTEYTKTYINPASPFFITNKDQKIVTVYKKGGDFTSVNDALAAITDASPTVLYTIQMGPGIFVEDTIVMKPYVTILGYNGDATIIQALDSSKNLIVGCPESTISYLQLGGATGTGAAAILYEGGIGIFVVDSIIFGQNYYFISVTSSNGPANIKCNACYIPMLSNANTAIKLRDSGTYPVYLLMTDLTQVDAGSNELLNGLDLSGPLTGALINQMTLTKFGGLGTGINISNGAQLLISNTTFTGFDTSIKTTAAGLPPLVQLLSVTSYSATSWDIRYEHPQTRGSITGTFDRNKVYIDPNISAVSVLFSDSVNQGTSILGNLYLADSVDNFVEVSEIITKSPTMGLYSGGEITVGNNLSINISSGNGYLLDSGVLRRYQWDGTVFVLPADTNNYIFVNSNGIFSSSTSQPDTASNILLGRVVTTESGIEFIDASKMEGTTMGNNLDHFNRRALGPIYEVGSIVTSNSSRELAVSAGVYFFSVNEFKPSGKPSGFTFSTYHQNGTGSFVRSTATLVDNQFYDNGSGTLQLLSSGFYAKHSFYIVGDGINETYLFVYSQTEYASLVEAEGGNIPVPPSYFRDGTVLIASVIVQQGNNQIVEIRDERPVIGFKASGVSAAAVHGNLLGLDADDHKQYLLVNGARPFTGDANMGGNNITNVNLVKGIDITSHAGRHLPLGTDPIATAAPTSNLTADTTNAEGIQNSFARSDHVHAISTGVPSQILPDQANSTGTSANLARADHIHHIPTGIPVPITNSNSQGTANTFSRSDHSHEGLHSLKTNSSGTARTGDIILQQGSGTVITDSGTGIFTIDTIGGANELVVSSGSGLIAAYTGGRISINGTITNIPSGTIGLAPNATDGTIFVSTLGTVSQSMSSTFAPNSVPLARYSTNSSSITSMTDVRVFVKNNVVFGSDSDMSNLTATATASAGITNKYAMADHVHTIATGVVSTIAPDQINTTGTSDNLARADHIHQILTAAPATILSANTANTQGSASTFARSDHTHAISTGTPSSQLPDQTNTVGTAAGLARADHIHSIPTAAPVTNLGAATSNSRGTANTFARSDHSHAIATAAPSQLIPDQTNAAGTSTSLARADHIHHIPTATAVSVGGSNAQGSASTFSRSDHVHQGIHSLQAGPAGTQRYGDLVLQAGNGTTIADSGTGIFTIDTTSGGNELLVTIGSNLGANYTAGRANINGTIYNISSGTIVLPAITTNGTIFVSTSGVVSQSTSDTFPANSIPLATYTTGASTITAITDARAFLRNQMIFGSVGEISNISANAVASTGITNRYAMADHTHAVLTAAATTQIPDQSNAMGTSGSLARADHVHSIPTAAPLANLSATTSNAQGSAATFARSDHSHAIATAIPSTLTPDQTNFLGASASLARADHIHNLATAAPTTNLSANTTNTQGSAATFSRSDHTHAILAGTPSTQVPDQSNAAGSSASFARADHTHNIPTAVPVTIGTANSQGTASAFARSDHVHNHGNQSGGSLHAVATTSTAGFMSSTDKSKLDGINASVGATWLISEQYSQGTNAGTLSSGSSNIRVLNTNSNNTNTTVTLNASNYQITFQPGTYKVYASAPGFNCNAHQIIFQNVNNITELYYGSSEFASRVTGSATSMPQTRSFLQCQLTLASATTYGLYHRAQSTQSQEGMGRAANLGTEVYAMVEIQKI